MTKLPNPMIQDKTDDETSLPRATVDKLIQELLPATFTITKEARSALREMCHVFLNTIALEASKICEVENKKTINNNHVFKAFEKHGFSLYVEACKTAAIDYDDYAKHKPSKQNKFKESGKTLEELHEDQMRLFSQAKQEVNAQYGIKELEESTTSD